MKFCLSSRQHKDYLAKANEIMVEYRDRKIIPDLVEFYPEATVILRAPVEDDVQPDWSEIKDYNIISRGRMIYCFRKVEDVAKCKEIDLPFYCGFPIVTYEDLRALKELGACYVRAEGPLFFDLATVQKFGVPVRVVANVATENYFQPTDGVASAWIRPEDVDAYSEYVDAIEFEDKDIQKEQALFRIYAEQKEWPGELKMLITNLRHEGTNRMIPPEFGERRLACKQQCVSGGRCKICYTLMKLADPEKLRPYLR